MEVFFPVLLRKIAEDLVGGGNLGAVIEVGVDVAGRSDIVLPKYKTVIFVNGCFWHKHDCPRFVWPSSNQEYWVPKITANVERDKNNHLLLQNSGWNVIIVWECELKKATIPNRFERLVTEIREGISNGTDQP